MVGHPHPIVMLNEVETSPGKGMMQIAARLCVCWSVQARKRISEKLIRSALINGMCLFEVRAATAARKRMPSLTYSTSEWTSLDSFRPRTSDIKRER